MKRVIIKTDNQEVEKEKIGFLMIYNVKKTQITRCNIYKKELMYENLSCQY